MTIRRDITLHDIFSQLVADGFSAPTAAKNLGIAVQTLYRRLDKAGYMVRTDRTSRKTHPDQHRIYIETTK